MLRGLPLLLALCACAAPAARPVVAPTPYQADIDTLETIATALHPGLTRYHSPAEVHALFADSRARMAKVQTLGEAYLELTRLTAAIRCGHTYPNFSNQSKVVAAALLHKGDKGSLTATTYARKTVELEVEGMLKLGEVWLDMKKAAGKEKDKTWKDDVVNAVLASKYTEGTNAGQTVQSVYEAQYEAIAAIGAP